MVGVQKEITAWIIKVKKIKAIYHTLNMCNFDLSHNSLIAECWCPVMALEDVQRGLKHGTVGTSFISKIPQRLGKILIQLYRYYHNLYSLMFELKIT